MYFTSVTTPATGVLDMHIEDRQKDRDLLPLSWRRFSRPRRAGVHDFSIGGRQHQCGIVRRVAIRIAEEEGDRDGQDQQHCGQPQRARDEAHDRRRRCDADERETSGINFHVDAAFGKTCGPGLTSLALDRPGKEPRPLKTAVAAGPRCGPSVQVCVF